MPTTFAPQIPSDYFQLVLWCKDSRRMIETLLELQLLPETNDCFDCSPREYDTMKLVRADFHPNGFEHECQSCWEKVAVTEGSWFLEKPSISTTLQLANLFTSNIQENEVRHCISNSF
jgi:hypothetical protein